MSKPILRIPGMVDTTDASMVRAGGLVYRFDAKGYSKGDKPESVDRIALVRQDTSRWKYGESETTDNDKNPFSFPKGKIDLVDGDYEDWMTASLREIREETGLPEEALIHIAKNPLTYWRQSRHAGSKAMVMGLFVVESYHSLEPTSGDSVESAAWYGVAEAAELLPNQADRMLLSDPVIEEALRQPRYDFMIREGLL